LAGKGPVIAPAGLGRARVQGAVGMKRSFVRRSRLLFNGGRLQIGERDRRFSVLRVLHGDLKKLEGISSLGLIEIHRELMIAEQA